MSPNHIRAKAEKYRKLFGEMSIRSRLLGQKPLIVTIKYSTLCDLVGFLDELAEKKEAKP